MKWDAGLYRDKHSFVYEYGAQIVDLLAPQASEKILDLGCGSGELTESIKDAGAEVYGIDSSPEMIAKARASYPKIDFRVMDATEIDFDFEFDAVFSNAVFHWIKTPGKAAIEIFRNLKRGGRIVMEFGGRGNVQSIVEAVKNSLSKRNLRFEEIWYFPTIGEFSGLLEECGFKVVYARHFLRQTELAEGDNAVIDWLEMFGEGFFKGLDEEVKSQIFNEIKENLRPTNYRDGKWYADYQRIRVIAIK